MVHNQNRILEIVQIMKLDKENFQKRLLTDALSESSGKFNYDCQKFSEKIDEEIRNLQEEIEKLDDKRPYFTEITEADKNDATIYKLVGSDRMLLSMVKKKKYSREIVNEEGELFLQTIDNDNSIVYLLKKFRFINLDTRLLKEEILLLETKKYEVAKVCYKILENQLYSFRSVLRILYPDKYDSDYIQTLKYTDLNSIAISINQDDFLSRYKRYEKKLYRIYLTK